MVDEAVKDAQVQVQETWGLHARPQQEAPKSESAGNLGFPCPAIEEIIQVWETRGFHV
jgi:hypothetical protein